MPVEITPYKNSDVGVRASTSRHRASSVEEAEGPRGMATGFVWTILIPNWVLLVFQDDMLVMKIRPCGIWY